MSDVAVGLLPPWLVSSCTFAESSGRLDIYRIRQSNPTLYAERD